MISSSTKTMAASGALNTAASPAAAPAAHHARRPCLATPAAPAAADIVAAPICTDGPSGPRLVPVPSVIAEATIFVAASRKCSTPKSRQNASFTGSTPPPPAEGASQAMSPLARALPTSTHTSEPQMNTCGPAAASRPSVCCSMTSVSS